MAEAKFAVGIDLGTTNCALAYLPLESEGEAPQPFLIPQVIHPGEVESRPLLPSFLYLPSQVELRKKDLALPWDHQAQMTAGLFARKRGSASPGRQISSAKSWLSHAGIDRRAAILPWESDEEELTRLSPLQATTHFLEHLRQAWDREHPEALLAEQELVITVPASFDAVARELTVEAAKAAGLGEHFKLLEEPQAALYAWLADRGAAWRDEVALGDQILVFDIGGGTTDFSLIEVRKEEGHLGLERIAVGEHILLGGDNMDLALAYTVAGSLGGKGRRLSDWQMRSLTHSCRVAKETLFSDPERESHPLVIPGRGSRLIGGTIRSKLTRAQLDATLLDGFFPKVKQNERPKKLRRMGLKSLGLPFASDAGISRHLAAFLGRDGLKHDSGRSFLHPTTILFNGGVSRSSILRERILSIINSWVESEGGSAPKVLEGMDPSLSVSRGAAWSAYTRRQGGVRILGGTARSYYIGVERSGLAVPGMPPQVDALCIAPFGMEEGSELELGQSFGLVVGELTSFRFFCSMRQEDEIGEALDPEELEELVPIETTLKGEEGRFVPVRLHAHVTEIGTLELSAVEEGAQQRWKLTFNVRID